MPRTLRLNGLVNCLALTLLAAAVGASGAPPLGAHVATNDDPPRDSQGGPEYEPVVKQPHLDLTGRKRVGKASIYAKRFAGKKMADGTPMLPQGDNAASKTLPLGTTAKVTNLETGQSAVVTIRDRGPYIKGRIVELTASTAKEIGIEPHNGVAKVEVAPIAVPLPDGSVKPGAADKDSKQDRSAKPASETRGH